MVVKVKGGENQIKISSLSEGRGIITDVVAVMEEAGMGIKKALDSGDKIFLKKLPNIITITLKAVQKFSKC